MLHTCGLFRYDKRKRKQSESRIKKNTELSEQHKAKQQELTCQTNLAQTRFDLDRSASESAANVRKFMVG